MKPKISVIIYAINDKKNVADCTASAKLLTDSVIIIDEQSVPANVYVEPARGYGIEKADSEWVFILDADERITAELAEEIRKVISNKVISNYKLPRKNIFGNSPAGGWLRHGGWWPDYQTRLINKKYFKSWPKEIHSTPVIAGETGYLKQPLLHYFHGDVKTMVQKTIIFEDIESELLYKAKRNASTLTFFRKFLAELYRRLIRHAGFLDGTVGIIESIYQAFSKTVTYLYLYEKKSRSL